MVDDLPAVPESAEDLGSQIGRELPSGPFAVIAAGAHEGDVGLVDARFQQGVHHHREDDLHGACRTGGIVESDCDLHARLGELLERRGSAGLLDGLAGRDGGLGQCTRVVELDHGGVLGDRDLERAIAEVDRGALGAHRRVAGPGTRIPSSTLAITLSPAGHRAVACSAASGRAKSYWYSSGIRRAPRSWRVVTQEMS